MNREEYERLIRQDPSAAAFIQRMKGSWRNGSYYRACPRHVLNPSPAVIKARLAFTQINYSSFGVKGKRAVNGIAMPPCCEITQRRMKGRRFSSLTTREKRFQSTISKVNSLRAANLDRALEKLAKAMTAIVTAKI